MSRYYAYRILPSGQRRRLTPSGRRVFGSVALAWLRRRAKRDHYRMVVGTIADKRSAGLAWMKWALSNEASFHYQQSRPMPLHRMRDHRLPISTDCSGSTTGCFYAVDARDPNGRHYDGSGNTATIREHLPRRPRASDCQVMDPIVYGGMDVTRQHVVMVYEPGPDPLVFSHGQESGPKLYRHSVELAYHGGYCTFHNASVD